MAHKKNNLPIIQQEQDTQNTQQQMLAYLREHRRLLAKSYHIRYANMFNESSDANTTTTPRQVKHIVGHYVRKTGKYLQARKIDPRLFLLLAEEINKKLPAQKQAEQIIIGKK